MVKIVFKGILVILVGEFVKVGILVLEFILVKGDLSNYILKDGKGKYLILNIFFSMDIGVCVIFVCKFNQLVVNQFNMVVLVIFKDLLFVQGCFCIIEGIINVIFLFDYCYIFDFVEKYGVLMIDGFLVGLLVCLVVVIDLEGKVVYIEFVFEIIQELNYEVVLKVVK